MSSRRGWPGWGRDGSWVVALLLAVTGACAPGGKTNAKEKGAVMTSEGVRLRRLGTLSPHLTYRGTTDRDFVDPASIVLWHGSAPALALGFEVESRWRKAVQKIAPLEEGVKVPGFPVTCTLEAHDDATSEDSVDAIDPRGAGTLDLDGDGAEELLVPRRHGGVEVHSLRGPLARYPSPGGGYRRFSELDVKIGARDVAYVLSRSDQEGVSDRNLLLRVDGKGVTRVTLQGLEKREIRALGALQRKGSPDVDELLVLAAGERGGRCSRATGRTGRRSGRRGRCT